MYRENKRTRKGRLALYIGAALLAAGLIAFTAVSWLLTDAEINGAAGLLYAARMELGGAKAVRYQKNPPKFLLRNTGEAVHDLDGALEPLGVTRLCGNGYWAGLAFIGDKAYTFYGGSFTSRYIRLTFQEASKDEVRTVVYHTVAGLCLERYGCEGPVSMGDTFDELNILPHEREDMALTLEEMYGVAISDEALASFVTLEDLVGYIEDRL